jgi:HD-like signal output (HDOD) protein
MVRALPALPATTLELISILNSPVSNADDVAGLVRQDPALTATVLRFANSAFYGMPRSVSSVASAVVVIGFNAVRSIVLSESMMNLMKLQRSATALDLDKFWYHSCVTACAAKKIACAYMVTTSYDPETLFCAGMLHDIGKLVLDLCEPKRYTEALLSVQQNGMSCSACEDACLGINHTQLGKILADTWTLPLELEYAIVYHHTSHECESALHEFVAVIHCANYLAHAAGAHTVNGEGLPSVDKTFFQHLSLQGQTIETVAASFSRSLIEATEFSALINKG